MPPPGPNRSPKNLYLWDNDLVPEPSMATLPRRIILFWDSRCPPSVSTLHYCWTIPIATMSNEEMKNTCVNKTVLAKTGKGHFDSRYNLPTPNPRQIDQGTSQHLVCSHLQEPKIVHSTRKSIWGCSTRDWGRVRAAVLRPQSILSLSYP